MKASSSAALDCCAQSRRFVLFVFHGAITITTSARETYATPRPALNTPVHSMVALYTVNTLAASTRLPRRYIDYPSFANARLSYNWRRTERSAHAQHAPDSACPLEERKQRTRHHRVTTVSSTGKVRHMLTSLRAPRVARTPQTQPGSRRAEACGATGRLPGCGGNPETSGDSAPCHNARTKRLSKDTQWTVESSLPSWWGTSRCLQVCGMTFSRSLALAKRTG